MLSSPLRNRVVLTVAYTDQFDWPLTAQEVWQRLIGVSASQREVVEQLRWLVEQKLLEVREEYYFLPGRKEVVTTRKVREKIASSKQQLVRKKATQLAQNKLISGIFVTGSLAVNNTSQQDDIDLMIVTQPNSLWLVRWWVKQVWSGRHQVRSWLADQRGETKPDSLCLNLWLTTNSLVIPVTMRGLYTAYEVCQVKPLFDRSSVYQAFLKANRWVNQYLPNYYAHRLQVSTLAIKQSRNITNFSDKLNLGRINNYQLAIINYTLYLFQRLYMLPHLTTEKVGLKHAYFHPRDTKGLILSHWRVSVQKIM